MKAMIDNVKIKEDDFGFLHIIFSCSKDAIDETENVFISIRDQASVNKNPLKWHQIGNELGMNYNKQSGSLDFFVQNADKKLCYESLLDLPRRLSVDWQVIDMEEASRLVTFLKLNPLIASLNSDLQNTEPKKMSF